MIQRDNIIMRFRRLFGSDEVGIVGLITDNVYTPEVLQKIKHLTEEIQKS